MNLIKNISKHSPSYTLSLIKECGGLDAISICLKDLDVHVRESALLAISSIARHDDSISTFFVKSGNLLYILQYSILGIYRIVIYKIAYRDIYLKYILTGLL